MSKSKMGDAFRAQLGRVPMGNHAREKLGRELDSISAEAAKIEAALRRDEYATTAKTWFFYGWQACERSKKP